MAEPVNSDSDQDSPGLKPSAADVLQLEEYRKLTREHLETLPALFTKLTGLDSSVCWAPTWPHRWSEADLPTRSWLCRQIAEGNPAVASRCRECGMRHLAQTLKSGHAGHHFLCRHAVRNFWFPIIIRHCPVGIAFVQALDGAAGRRRGGRKEAATSGAGTAPAIAAPRRHRAEGRRMSPREFKQDARLLQLIFEHAETLALADLRKKDLVQAQHALVELQTVATRLREELNGLVPAFNKASPVLQSENHAGQIVHAAMDYVHQHYAQPLTLHECARSLHLNASYLSDLFARTVGLSFKTYLTDVRLEKARLLLNDPAKNIGEVASAVGYASENRFRLAFKKLTGLAPKLWRETLRAPPIAAALWLVEEMGVLEGLGFSFLA